jgi:hypothetical protein
LLQLLLQCMFYVINLKMPKFTEDFKLINQPQEVRSDCNQLTVINTGTATAVLNGLEIAPGDQYVSPGNENELNITRYRLSFTGIGTEQVLVIRKIYQ